MIKLNLQNQTLQRLQQLIGGGAYDFLGFALDLETGVLSDQLTSNSMRDTRERDSQIFAALLGHYAPASPTSLSGKLVKFKDLSGGDAYEGAFVQRAIEPIG